MSLDHAVGATPPLSPEDPTPGTIALHREDGRAIVALAGEHDLGTSNAVEAALRAAAAGGSDVVVDLSGCTFIDCSILRAISRVAADASVTLQAADDTAPIVRLLLELLEDDAAGPIE